MSPIPNDPQPIPATQAARKFKRVERLGWIIRGGPGEAAEIPKAALNVDPSYQRQQSDDKVRRIARSWSWMACGTLLVARRNGRYYIFDGGHRWSAAMLREDIVNLPCRVWDCATAEEEAAAFLEVNRDRKPITSYQQYAAKILTGDPTAILVKQRLADAGYEAVECASKGRTLKCVGALLVAFKTYPETMETVWRLAVEVADGGPIREKVIQAMLYLENRITPDDSLANAPWRQALIKLGNAAIEEACIKMATLYKRGGAEIWGRGLAVALNRGRRTNMILSGD